MIIGKYFLIHDSQDVHNKKLKKYFVAFNICVGIIASISLPIIVPYIFPQFTEIGILAIMSLSVIPTAIIVVKTSELLGNEKSAVVVIGALTDSNKTVTLSLRAPNPDTGSESGFYNKGGDFPFAVNDQIFVENVKALDQVL